MTLRHFQIFLKVYDEGGMTRAAEKMHISQPSVSQAVRELEEHYKVRLFERLGKRLFLTAAGQELMHYARHVTNLTNQAESALRGYSLLSPLRIGATLSIGESIFISLLQHLKEKVPGQPIFSRIHNTATLEQYLLQDELDIALVEGNIESEYLQEIPFMEDELILAAAPGNKTVLTKDELAACDFIMREEGSGTRNLFDQVMKEQQLAPRIAGVYNNSASIKQATMANLGITALSSKLMEKEIGDGSLIRLTVPDIQFKRNFRLVYHTNKYLTPSLKLFIEICHAYAEELPL
ncbi:MAG: LysR family transcriptional regulator [Selenomonadaceae bacterium]|nr:LysR family transcriptional regulator [Selenomonadaceae bacterium]